MNDWYDPVKSDLKKKSMFRDEDRVEFYLF